jgi:hypothetical protein
MRLFRNGPMTPPHACRHSDEGRWGDAPIKKIVFSGSSTGVQLDMAGPGLTRAAYTQHEQTDTGQTRGPGCRHVWQNHCLHPVGRRVRAPIQGIGTALG